MGNKLCEIMRYEQKELQIGFSKASLEGRSTPQEVADRREELIKAFFKKYFPSHSSSFLNFNNHF